jgi:chemotaxis signal transduction protein
VTVLVMPVRLADAWIAIDATHVHEVLGGRPWVALPDAPAHVPGVISWRGRAIAVLDLGALLGVAPALAAGEIPPRLLVAQLDEAAFAIPVQAAREVHAVPAVEPAHATHVRLAQGQVTIGGVVMPMVSLQVAYAAVAQPGAERA